MRAVSRATAGVIAAGFMVAGMGVASAGGPVSPVVGPGTSIGTCTLTTAGHDLTGNAVALTAGHCMLSPGADVYSQGQHIGHYASWSSQWALLQSNGSDDWAVIQLDPAVRITTRAPNGQVLDHWGTLPAVGSQLTKYGQTTGTTAGRIASLTNDVLETCAVMFEGDSGGPAYQGSGIVGLTSVTTPLAPFSPFWYSGAPRILEDLNTRPGTVVGAGFHIG